MMTVLTPSRRFTEPASPYSPALRALREHPGGQPFQEKRMDDTTRQRIAEVQQQLDRLAVRLGSHTRPGHVDYISKTDAAQICWSLISDLRAIKYLDEIERVAVR
jgi:hypothetical protein